MALSESLAGRIYYRPLESQIEFHRSRARFKGFSGPVGSGKSQALCQEAIRLSYVNAGRQGLLGAPTYSMLRDATLASFLQVLDRNSVPYEYRKAESVITMLDTGSQILLRSLDHFERLRGTNLAWFGIDELTYAKEEAWLRLEARLRDPEAKQLCGFAVWTPKGFDWVYRRFVRERIAGYGAILAKPFENRHLLDKVPDFYERLKNSYDGRMFEQEALGGYVNVHTGTVYHCFDRARHVRQLDQAVGEPLLWALDFNVEPMCSVVVQKVGDQLHVLDEVVLSRASTEQACEEFCRRFGSSRGDLTIYGDASGARMQTSGTNDYAIIRNYMRAAGRKVSFRVPRRNPSVRERVTLVNSKLMSASGMTEIKIDGRCKHLIRDLEEVVYKADSGVIDKDRDPRLTHLSDALGYLIWQECGEVSQVGEINQRLL